jgi:hypothetical protein
MEIIEHGKEYREMYCPECNCKFAYTPIDIKKEDSFGRPGTLRCPECNHTISLW